ncbi:MAG: hypothetical protein ABSH32_35370 [Bryobacteraceae bacterium]|jgi:hypothetical protein
MNGFAILLALLFAGQTPPASQVRITRAALSGVEKNFDGHFARANTPDSFDLLGNTRGVYLEGFGAVFSSELNLLVTPNLNPFHTSFTKPEIARIHERKLERVLLLRQNMRQMLVASAAALENLPPQEQIVLAVTLFHYSWEDYSGLPSQIVMQAQRQQLLSNATRETAIRTQEF